MLMWAQSRWEKIQLAAVSITKFGFNHNDKWQTLHSQARSQGKLVIRHIFKGKLRPGHLVLEFLVFSPQTIPN